MRRMFVGNLSADTSEAELQELFSQHGTVRGIDMAKEVFSGRCRGFAFVDMEGHEARAAMAALDGTMFKGRALRVNEEQSRGGRSKGRRKRR